MAMQGNVVCCNTYPWQEVETFTRSLTQSLSLVQVEKSYQWTIFKLIETPQVFENFKVLMSSIETWIVFGVVKLYLTILIFHQIQFKERAMGSKVFSSVVHGTQTELTTYISVVLCLSSRELGQAALSAHHMLWLLGEDEFWFFTYFSTKVSSHVLQSFYVLLVVWRSWIKLVL